MTTTTSRAMLDADELNPTDAAILDLLQDHPCTPAYIAQETGYTKGNIRGRLNHLKSHDHVTNIGGGMWKLVEDPRKK